MKTTLNALSCLILFVSLSLSVSAQAIPDTARLTAGVELGLPTSSIGSRYSFNAGASVRYDLPVGKKTYLTASVGFNNFFLENGATTTQAAILNVPVPTLKTLPLKVGYKQFIIKHFYVQLEMGETMVLNQDAVYATKQWAFTYAPQIGMLFPLKKGNYIDAGIRYEVVSSFYNDSDKYNFWGVHIAYALKL